MMKGRNNGKKLLALRIVAHAFEIIHLLSDQNPIQVLVDAIVNTGPREDSTRIGSQGTVRRQAVDVSPLRRVNQAISLLTTGVSTFARVRDPHRLDIWYQTRESAFRNVKSVAECLADELINAAKGSSNSYAIKVRFHFISLFVRTKTTIGSTEKGRAGACREVQPVRRIGGAPWLAMGLLHVFSLLLSLSCHSMPHMNAYGDALV